jgi:hypothetical protein
MGNFTKIYSKFSNISENVKNFAPKKAKNSKNRQNCVERKQKNRLKKKIFGVYLKGK